MMGCPHLLDYRLSNQYPAINMSRKAELLSAFFDLDIALPQRAKGIWTKAPGKDGMPLVFSHEITPQSIHYQVSKI